MENQTKKTPLLRHGFSEYESIEPFCQRQVERSRLDRKWQKRFWILLLIVSLTATAALILSVFSYVKSKDYIRQINDLQEQCLAQDVDNKTMPLTAQLGTNSAFKALPSNLQSQLLLSIPSQSQLKGTRDQKRKPNFLIFIADDLGFGDFAIDGHPTQPWGPLDELASKGMRFRNFYVDAFCTPSRAQFLTGRLAMRSGMSGQNPRVLLTGSPGGLPDSEITIPELLRDEAGYATGMNGKWHLGVNCKRSDDGCHLPFNHGFDEVGTYFPISNNLVCDETKRYSAYPNPSICFLYKGKGTTPYQAPVYHENLTHTLVTEAKDFITTNRDRPWFYYYASPQTHDVMYSSQKFTGSTQRGDFGDALNEMSWSAGELIRHLNSLNLLQDTMVVFFADNGAPNTDCLQAGNNGLLRSGKGTAWDGGNRATSFVYWPGTVAEGVISHAVLSSADLFPTIANLANTPVPTDRPIDGLDMSHILFGNGIQSQADSKRPIFFYCGNTIFAVRYNGYKLHFFTNNDPPDDCYNGQPPFVVNPVNRVLKRQNCNDSNLVQKQDPPLLFNLDIDPSEKFPLDINSRQDLLKEFQKVIDAHEATVTLVPDQLQGFDPRILPCCDWSKGCVCNYPLAHKFDFPKRFICIVSPDLCIQDSLKPNDEQDTNPAVYPPGVDKWVPLEGEQGNMFIM